MVDTKRINNPPDMDELKRIVTNKGFRISAGCWEDSEHIFAFSRELAPGTMGDSVMTAHYNKISGWLSIIGGQ